MKEAKVGGHVSDLLSTQLPPIPVPGTPETNWSQEEIEAEAHRLQDTIAQHARWTLDACRAIAPTTLEIQKLKREKNAFILAHSYQTPDIIYGVADAVGDSYGLAKIAKQRDEDTIVFSSVRFMAETAKIVNPQKTVLHPSPQAGCSLADGITAADVRKLKEQHPGVPVVCYINTTADVKAECDASVTSSNYLDICRKLPGDELVFVPDAFMGRHLQNAIPEKTFHLWDATCEVHDRFTGDAVRTWKENAAAAGTKLHVLVHPECGEDVLAEADYIGSTEKMMDHARSLEAGTTIMPITECGTADRMRAEMPQLSISGACVLCPHMKQTRLHDILQVLQSARADQIIEIDGAVLEGAQANLQAMFDLAE